MKEDKKVTILYRYEIEYYTLGEWPVTLILREYRIKRETERTYFIQVRWKEKRVRKGAWNTFAFPTKREALEHFKRRTHKRIKWFDYWKANCQAALDLAETIGDETSKADDTDELFHKYFDE